MRVHRADLIRPPQARSPPCSAVLDFVRECVRSTEDRVSDRHGRSLRTLIAQFPSWRSGTFDQVERVIDQLLGANAIPMIRFDARLRDLSRKGSRAYSG